MKYLFVSTDSSEAQKMLEGLGNRGCQYHDIDVNTGERLKRRIGFNPMCSIVMNGQYSERDFDRMVARLSKEMLYVASEVDGSVQTHTTQEAQMSEYRIRSALQRKILRLPDFTRL